MSTISQHFPLFQKDRRDRDRKKSGCALPPAYNFFSALMREMAELRSAYNIFTDEINMLMGTPIYL
jgi:hypothetical protein